MAYGIQVTLEVTATRSPVGRHRGQTRSDGRADQRDGRRREHAVAERDQGQPDANLAGPGPAQLGGWSSPDSSAASASSFVR